MINRKYIKESGLAWHHSGQFEYRGFCETHDNRLRKTIPWADLIGRVSVNDVILFIRTGEYVKIVKSVSTGPTITQGGYYLVERKFGMNSPRWKGLFVFLGFIKQEDDARYLLCCGDKAYTVGYAIPQRPKRKRWWRK